MIRTEEKDAALAAAAVDALVVAVDGSVVLVFVFKLLVVVV